MQNTAKVYLFSISQKINKYSSLLTQIRVMTLLTYFHLILTISAMSHVCATHINQDTMISDNQNRSTAVLATTTTTTMASTETATTGTLLDTFFGHDTDTIRESEGTYVYIQLRDYYRFYIDLHSMRMLHIMRHWD